MIKIRDGGVIINGLYLSIPNIELKRPFPPGANGIVFEAHDVLLDRRVAAKIWIPSKRDRRDRRKQALAEASKLAQLEHKNIGRIYLAGEAGGYIYSIMEYLDGVTLRDFLNSAESHLQQRYRIWDEIEDALHYAYAKGIYHGDLHDRNVIVVKGSPKIIDFGTSIFAPSEIDTQYRESRVLRELTERLFSQDTPKLAEIIDEDIPLPVMMPETTLSAMCAWRNVIVAWAEIVETRRRMSKDEVSYMTWKHMAYAFGSWVCEAPIFSVPRIEQLLIGLELPTDILSLFRVGISLWANMKLNEMFIPHDTDTILHPVYRGIPTEDMSVYETYKAEWLKRAKQI